MDSKLSMVYQCRARRRRGQRARGRGTITANSTHADHTTASNSAVKSVAAGMGFDIQKHLVRAEPARQLGIEQCAVAVAVLTAIVGL